ncbi:MAG TPA: GSCFA domain-containing protein, partial [Bacteroidia bacterium]|nr:GSCFA domain-containing protein [Bacteroidia bacterium]
MHYFPSYEIITGSFNRGRYYSDDLRNVTEEGVAHVMRLFLRHAAGEAPMARSEEGRAKPADDFVARAQALVDVECDEVALDRPEKRSSGAVR